MNKKKYINSFKTLAEKINNLPVLDKLVFYVTYTFKARILVYKPKYQINGLWYCIANFFIDAKALKVKIKYSKQIKLEKAIYRKLKIKTDSHISFIKSFIFCRIYLQKLSSLNGNWSY